MVIYRGYGTGEDEETEGKRDGVGALFNDGRVERIVRGTSTDISRYSVAIQNWISHQMCRLDCWQVEEWVKYLASRDKIAALRFIRQCYDTILDDSKVILDAVLRRGWVK